MRGHVVRCCMQCTVKRATRAVACWLLHAQHSFTRPTSANQVGWIALWPVPLGVLASYILQHGRSTRQAKGTDASDAEAPKGRGSARIDAAAVAARPAPCSGTAWRRCCGGFASCLGWSSIGFLAAFGFLLALQAAWSASDELQVLRHPPGLRLQVPIDGSTSELLRMRATLLARNAPAGAPAAHAWG